MPGRLRVNDGSLTAVELVFLRELTLSGARFMLVGMTAAILQGADVSTRDIDLWVDSTSGGKLGDAARRAGGLFVWRADPPYLEGRELARVDLVNRMSGLGSFDVEYAGAVPVQVDDFEVVVLPLVRILASKTAANRSKDKAALHALRAALAAQKFDR